MVHRKDIYATWRSEIKKHLDAYNENSNDREAAAMAFGFVAGEMDPSYTDDAIKQTPYSEECDEWCSDDNRMREQYWAFKDFVYFWYQSVSFSYQANNEFHNVKLMLRQCIR